MLLLLKPILIIVAAAVFIAVISVALEELMKFLFGE